MVWVKSKGRYWAAKVIDELSVEIFGTSEVVRNKKTHDFESSFDKMIKMGKLKISAVKEAIAAVKDPSDEMREFLKTEEWTEEELSLLEEGSRLFGDDFESVRVFVGTKTIDQIKEKLTFSAEKKRHRSKWSKKEIQLFNEAYELCGSEWTQVAEHVGSRTLKQVMKRVTKLGLDKDESESEVEEKQSEKECSVKQESDEDKE